MPSDLAPKGGHPRWVAVLLVLGTLVTLVAIFSIWANRQLLNTDNWVSASSRFLANEKIDEQLSNYLAEQFVSHDNLRTTLESELPEGVKPLGAPVAGALHELAPRIAERVIENPNVQQLWADANRLAHERLLAVLDGGGSKLSTENGIVALELGPLVEQVGKEIGVGVAAAENLPPDAGRLVILKSDQLSAAQNIAKAVRRLPIVLTLLALVLFGAAILLAGPRRRQALRSVGIGFLVAGVLVLILRALGGHWIVNNLVASETVRPAASDAWDIGTSLLRTVAASTVAFGVLVFLAAWLAGPTGAATALRREASPWVRRNPPAAYGVGAGVFLVLVAWAPVAAFRKPLGILILALLIAAGAELLRRQIVREFPNYEGGDLGDRLKGLAGRAPGRGPSPAPAGVGATAGVGAGEAEVAQLERLAALHREGDLSDEEYARAKASLLPKG